MGTDSYSPTVNAYEYIYIQNDLKTGETSSKNLISGHMS